MRVTTLAGVAAVAAAALAVLAAFLAPHPLIRYLRPSPHGIITFGQIGQVSPEEARNMLNPLESAFAGSATVVWGSFGGSEGEGYDYTQTNVQVPGVDEGDILKLAPPYGLYATRGTLYLLRLWPPEEMEVLDAVNLTRLVASVIGASKVKVDQQQILIDGGKAVVMVGFHLNAVPPFPSCSGYYTLTADVAGKRLEFRIPKCSLPPYAGTVVAVYEFGDGVLRLVSNHTITGMRLIESRVSEGIAYLFLAPSFWISLGNERIDGIDILEAGPTYVASESSLGKTLATVVALNPGTGEVGVTNIILPFEAFTYNMIAYMKGDEAYLLIKDSPDIPEDVYARLITSCSDKAPTDLRSKLESLGPNPSPSDILSSIKEWVRSFADEAAPIIEWVHNITKGVIMGLGATPSAANAEIPAEVNESIERIVNVSKKLSDFASCIEVAGKSLPGAATRIIKLGFTGVVGYMESSTKINGKVSDRFAVEESDDYLFVVGTRARPWITPISLPTQFSNFRYTLAGKEAAVSRLTWLTLMLVYQLNFLESARSLSDIFFVVEQGWNPRNTTLHILRADDLTPVATLTGIAPGKKVYAARYVNGYLYVVTYRQTDPLFAINVTDPENPEIIGWLEIPGYNEYLHPWGDRYLVGVGVIENMFLKVDLYDISDPTNIVRVSSTEIRGWSQALKEHHAFQPIDNETFAIPLQYWFGNKTAGIAVFEVSASGELTNLGFIEVASPQRSARINDAIYAFGAREVVAAQFPTLNVIKELSLATSTG